MSMRNRSLRAAIALAAAGACGSALAADPTSVASKWKVQEVKYSYVGYTTAYDCEAAESKLKEILTKLGAHSGTQVRANGCPAGRPSRNFFVTITAATPVPATEVTETSADQSREELLKRLGVKTEIGKEEFQAAWQSIDLSKDRRLDIRPGDCELLESLEDKVLPKLGMKIESKPISCTPNQLSIQPPPLRVSALVPLKSPDAGAQGASN